MPARKYSDNIIQRAAEMRETGKTVPEISSALGMSASAVYWYCLKLGADSPDGCSHLDRNRGPRLVRRGKYIVRRFSADEDSLLLSMEAAGNSLSAIAHELGRSRNSIVGRLMTLARHEDRTERQGEKGIAG